jgi:hypothetical protein
MDRAGAGDHLTCWFPTVGKVRPLCVAFVAPAQDRGDGGHEMPGVGSYEDAC